MPNPLSLAGRRILLPSRQLPALREAIEAAGGAVDEVALLDRRPVPGPSLEALPGRIRAGEIDWLVITSAYTPTALDQLGSPLAGLVTPRLRLAAVGPASAGELERLVGRVDLQPERGTGGAALAEVFPDGPGVVVVPGAVQQSPVLGRELIRRGWRVEPIGVYRTSPAAAVPAGVRARWQAGGYDALVLTSASVAASAGTLLGPAGPAVTVGETCAAAAAEAGFREVWRASSSAARDVVGTLESFLN